MTSPVDPLILEMAARLRAAAEALDKGAHFLRVIKLLAQGQVANLGNQYDLDHATPEQKGAWTVFAESSACLAWFEQAVQDYKDVWKPAEPAADTEAPAEPTDKPTTFH